MHLSVCILDFPIHIDTISMGLPIVYFKGSQVDFSKLHVWCIFVPEGCFNLSKQCRPDKMQHYAAFHLGFHCMSKYPFSGSQFTKG